MTWKSPEAFFLFIPFILIILHSIFLKKKITFQWSSLSPFLNIGASARVLLRWIPFFLQIVSVSLLIIALARPQNADIQIHRSTKGIDIIIAFDISFSMMVEDMNPGTRLDSAKKVIHEFIDGLNSDRVGLILFSGESYTKIPLTLDYSLLKTTVDQTETSSDIKQGTAIGVAIANSVARLRNSRSKSRVVILLTDGENNAGNINPETAISIAKGYGIKIYCVGIGNQGWAKIPIKYKDSSGREKKYYANINSKINKKLLSKIANETGGKFYLAKNLKEFKNIFNEIGNLEKTKIKVKKWVQFQENFQRWTKPAFFLFLISLILSMTIFGKWI